MFGELRTIDSHGIPYFCLVDVCRALDLKNPSMVKERLRGDGLNTMEGVSVTTNQFGKTSRQVVNLIYINEPNLYRCIFQSRKKEAEKFQDWVFDEVLPSIRKTGIYGMLGISDEIASLRKRVSELEEKVVSKKRIALPVKESNGLDEFIEYMGYFPADFPNGTWVNVPTIMSQYEHFCESNGFNPCSSVGVGRYLCGNGFDRKHRRDGNWYYLGGRKTVLLS